MHQVIILAGGGPRKGWTRKHPKVMAEVKGVPIVLRLVRQVRAEGFESIVLTNFKCVQAIVPQYYEPPPPTQTWHSEFAVQGLMDSIPLWSPDGHTSLLCGDSVYPPEIISMILKGGRPIISVWGTVEEIYGITFPVYEQERIKKAFERAYRDKETPGHLWAAYRALCGNERLGPHVIEDKIFRRLDKPSYICDFDSVEEYKQWLKNNQ